MNPAEDDIAHLLSPSKAREASARAKDWALVSSFLTRLYHPSPPPRFERNDDTLQALLSLIAANAAADERTDFLLRAQREELDHLTTARSSRDGGQELIDSILNTLETSLDPPAREALGGIAEMSVQLGSLSTDPETLGKDIIELTAEELYLEDQISEIGELRLRLENETAQLHDQLNRLKDEQARDEQETQQQQIADWNRASKMLGVKFVEYREKVAAFERNECDGLTIEDLREKEAVVLRQKGQLKKLEKELQGYHNLPPDLDAMKAEYQQLNTEVNKLQRKRDDLFENLAR